jgi:hypothetical protein
MRTLPLSLRCCVPCPAPSHARTARTAACDIDAVELCSFEGDRRLDGTLFAFHFYSFFLSIDRE